MWVINMEDIFEGEPLLVKAKSPKTQKERRSEALVLSIKGHLVSPLGRPKKKGNKLVPSRARPVQGDGNVTIPQLWAAYIDLFGKSFGLPDLLQTIMADTKENVSRFFDDIRQRMLECTGYLPENRDLYEYLIWFHKPERLKGLLSVNQKSGNIEYVHPNQLKGIVHIKRFYDDVMKSRNKNSEFVSERVADQHKMTTFVMEVYSKIRVASSEELVYCLVNYGYVLFAEFLHDYNDCDDSACRKRIIEVMVGLLRASTDKQKAISFLNYAWKATEVNEKCFVSAVWPDWREACKDMLDVAIKLSENQP